MTAIPQAAVSQARIREASISDYDQIAAVMARNGLTPRPRAAWMALWKGNPAFENGKRPIGWVLEAEGRLAGCVANVPRNYVFRGELVRAAAECDWAVDKMYRGYALALWQRHTRQANVELLLSTTVGPASEPTYTAYQWSRVPVGQWDQAGFWVAGYCGFLRSASRRKAVPLLARPLAYPLAAALFCRDRVLGGSLSRGRLTVEWRADFDKSFDVFWQDLRREKKEVLLAVRDCDTLRWQFQPGQARQNTWIAVVSNGSRLLGYAIFVRRDHPRSGLRRVRLVDFQALENPTEAFRSILTRAIARCRVEGIHMLEDIGCLAGRLGCPAPHRRQLDAWAYYYKAVSADLGNTLADPARWEPTSFEGDLSL
jgi:hypothetical protein